MKKLMLVLALVGFTGTSMAQTSELPTEKYSVQTNSFWSNWFVTAGASYNVFYSSQEENLGDFFGTFRRSWGAELTVGKWFTPALGVRLKGAGIWGTQVNGVDDVADCPTVKQWEVSGQLMLNLNNLFCGYKERVWNISPYIGLGVGHHMTSGGAYSPLYQFGIVNTFNITKRLFINIDIYEQLADANYDGNGEVNGDTRVIGIRDNKIGASLSIGVNLGKTGWDKAPDLAAITAMNAAQLAALNDQLAEQEAENARLKALLAKPLPKQEKVVTVKEAGAATPVSVFFNCNSSRIASKKDLVSVQALAEQAKQNGSKVTVTGFADSKTGSAAYNQTLSEKRAQSVADKLVEMGISRDNITVQGAGGVNNLTPFSYNRRAIVEVK